MGLVVQKYGGSSLATPERIRSVADRIAQWRNEGHDLVVTVSAMGGVTDSLLKLAGEISYSPKGREVDMLLATGEQASVALMAMALEDLGIRAVALTGAQAGIVTSKRHTRARIANITPGSIENLLEEGNVVVVAGFQGQTEDGQITTMGRGGSDLTAIAMATVLRAGLCQIYTDVEGVYTADPHLVSRARKIPEICYDEMLEMAGSGSKVMQARAVEFAKKFNIPFEVRSSFSKNPGTMVKEEVKSMEDVVVRGVSLEKDQAKVVIMGVPDRPGMAAKIFTKMSEQDVNIDVIVQNVAPVENQLKTDVTFTLKKSDLNRVRTLIESFPKEFGVDGVKFQEGIAKLSVVGIGMRSHSGVAATLFNALADAGVNIDIISTSEIKITVVIDGNMAAVAMNAAHDAFRLYEEAK